MPIMNTLKSIHKSSKICHKHPKLRTDIPPTHAPTLKCHEEVMSKLSSCANDDYDGDLNSCDEQICNHKKDTCKKVRVRTVSSKSLHQSVSAPARRLSGQRHKDLHSKTLTSKSIPIVQRTNFEDSVDFIPVKLTPGNDRKQRPQRRARNNLESRLGIREKVSKPYRPTWNEILKNNEEGDKPEKSLNKPPQSVNHTHCCHSEQSSAESLNKALNKTEACQGQHDNRQQDTHACQGQHDNRQQDTHACQGQQDNRQDTQKQSSESFKSSELSKSGRLPIFQHINSSDPIETLDFLIRQLRDGLLVQPQNDSLQNIIHDMENALLKISGDSKIYSSHQMDMNFGEKEDHSASIPQSAVSSSSLERTHWNVLQLEQNLERSCRYLQSLCIKQKENCGNHLREKEQLSLQLAESRRLLAISKSNEKNYEVTIGELRLKLQEANTKIDQLNQSLQDIKNKNATLTEENQAMNSLKQSLQRASVRLKQIASEKEKLQSKLSLKDLEIEKLKVLLQVKTGQQNDLQQENILQLEENELNRKNIDENDLSISLSTVTSWSDRPGLMCSSQASSSPRRSPSPYNSWQFISSIVQQPSAAVDINRGIAVIFEEMKKKSEQMEPPQLELQNPSSCSSLWSDRDGDGDKLVFSDGESGGFSS